MRPLVVPRSAPVTPWRCHVIFEHSPGRLPCGCVWVMCCGSRTSHSGHHISRHTTDHIVCPCPHLRDNRARARHVQYSLVASPYDVRIVFERSIAVWRASLAIWKNACYVLTALLVNVTRCGWSWMLTGHDLVSDTTLIPMTQASYLIMSMRRVPKFDAIWFALQYPSDIAEMQSVWCTCALHELRVTSVPFTTPGHGLINFSSAFVRTRTSL